MQSVHKSSGLRVVIITGRSPHQKNLCVRLAQKHEVVGILHPIEDAKGAGRLFKKLGRQINREGWGIVLLHALKGMPAGRVQKNVGSGLDAPNWNESVEAYNRLDKSLIFPSCNVKSPETHALLRSLRPDVAICLGGPVYPKELIEAAPLMLNF